MVFCDGQSYVKYSGLASKAHLFVFCSLREVVGNEKRFRRKSESRCKGIMEWGRRLVGRLELAQEAHVVFREHT